MRAGRQKELWVKSEPAEVEHGSGVGLGRDGKGVMTVEAEKLLGVQRSTLKKHSEQGSSWNSVSWRFAILAIPTVQLQQQPDEETKFELCLRN